MTKNTFSTALLATALAACSSGGVQFELSSIEFAGPPRSGEPNLFATADGRAMLTWFEESAPETHVLKVAVREGGSWTEARTIVQGDRFFVNWADFPSLVELEGGRWVAHWLEKSAPNTYAYHVKLSMSDDRGATWSDPMVPHRDLSPREHGFVSMVPMAGGGVAMVWLDGRNMANADGAGSGNGYMPGAMSIRATTLAADGSLGEEFLLDRRTCECCQTALVKTDRGLVAAYRDRSESEIRNIAVTRFENGRWSEPKAVHDDDWYFPGCPVNGPQLAARGDTVAIAWFTAPEQIPATYVAFSFDAGESFSQPTRIDDGDPLGRVDIVFLPHGAALVTWLERTTDAADLRARVVRSDGTALDPWVVAETSAARRSGFPRVVVVGSEVLFAWTETGETGGVRVVAARMFTANPSS